ncbi:MAG TPA: hypothetical protein VJO52_15825 [Gemmatimonadaceae bacterium]|nr:hypothetical protein [Gemmatimonadaceae bacterium]
MRHSLVGFGLLLLAPLGISAAAQSAGFAYAPGIHHYRIVTETHREQIQGGGRAPFEFDVTTTQLVTMNLSAKSRDTLQFEITIDSVDVSSKFNAPAPDVRRIFGDKVSGLISPQGKVYRFDPPAGTTDADIIELYTNFRPFLVSFPAKPIAAGTSWADTTMQHVERAGFDVTSRSISLTRVTGDTTVDGKLAWRVVRHTDIVQSGQSSAGPDSGKVSLHGQGTVNAVRVLSHDGVYLGSLSTQRIDLTTKNAISESAPITQTIKTTLERLPDSR